MKMVPLGEVVRFQAGFGFPPYLQGRKDGVFPFAKVGDISRAGRGGAKLLNSADHYVNEADLLALRAKTVPAGSTLFPKIGEAIKQNHRVMAGRELLIDNNAMAAIPTGELDAEYLYRFLQTVDMYAITLSTTVPALRKSVLDRLPIPMPPTGEQRRITVILDKADALRAKRREALSHLDALTQSIFHDMFGDPDTNPHGLDFKWLPEVGHLYSGGTPSKSAPANWHGNLPWFSPKDLKADTLADSIDHIDDSLPSRTSLKLLPKNTVAFVVRGMILAHTFPVALLKVPCTINQDLKAVRPVVPIHPYFLSTCLRAQSQHILGLVETAAHGTKRLDARALSSIRVLIPPMNDQEQFATRIAAIERLKDHHRTQLAKFDALFASLQHRAFNGTL